MKGFQAETLVKGEIRGMGLTQPRLPTEDRLIQLAARYAPKRLAQVQAALAEQGVSLYSLSSYDILDQVFGLDFVVRYKDEWIGIDVSVNQHASKRTSKAYNQEKLMPLYKALGLSKVGVYNPNLTNLRTFLKLV